MTPVPNAKYLRLPSAGITKSRFSQSVQDFVVQSQVEALIRKMSSLRSCAPLSSPGTVFISLDPEVYSTMSSQF